MYENIDKNLYTPMMRQYLTIKEDYPDTLVFFRLGDFYEMFFNDALVASKELEIVLTSRDAGTNNERVPMCGVPHHAVENYIERLSSKGYKVAIVEQMEEANNKKIVTREVTKIITPGTNVDELYLSEKDNSYLGAVEKIDEGFAFCYIDLSTGETNVTVLPNHIDYFYNELQKLNIKEIVTSDKFPKIYRDYLKNRLNILVSLEENTKIDDYLNNLVSDLDDKLVSVCKRLLCYIINTQKRVLVHLKTFKLYSNDDFLKLDSNSLKNLELIESLHGNRNKKNLFSLLDKCSTAMGSRFLKRSIIYPLTDYNKIQERLQVVEDLTQQVVLLTDLNKELSNIYDLERIVGRISYGNLSPRDLLQLKKSLASLPNIKKLLVEGNTKSFSKLEKNIETYDELFELLDKSIKEDAPYLLRDGNIIKAGYHEELDKIKEVSQTNKVFLTNLEIREKERTGIKSLKVGYNKVFGYYIEVTKANLSLITDDLGYIRKQTTSNSERFITEELKEREALILRADERTLQLEVELFNKIRDVCKTYSARLQYTASLISELDMLHAFAKVSKNENYVRPKFSLYGEIKIVEGRHPVIENETDSPFVPNDLTMYNDNLIMLITGPNMSGKSTFMRQTAIIAIMGQIGCFVPATKALLPIFDQIFTRIGSSDDISAGQSTFMMEMLEVNYALQNATTNSLIILDEVGRGTATFDGMALAQSIIEYLHDNVKAKTLFSTHYHELTTLDQSLPGLFNVHVEAKEEKGNIIFFHKVINGPTDQSYGINVASLAKLPLEVTLRAKDILEKLETSNSYETDLLSKNNYTKPVIINNVDPNELEVLNELKNLSTDDLKPIEALLKLAELKGKLGE
ncbi:MAG: DNA mismatch repair protein MutS [Bacilli bacterium]|nr:DNA mismatch repair protein MutS [Bacilli bacterium]